MDEINDPWGSLITTHPKLKKKKTKKTACTNNPSSEWDAFAPQTAVNDVPVVEAIPEVAVEDVPAAAFPTSDTAAQLHPISPYAEAPVTLHIGEQPTIYYVPSHLLQRGKIHPCGADPVLLPEIGISTGHTLVHYLYTEKYETLDASGGLEQALLSYLMAKNYEILGLAELAMHEVKTFCSEMDIFEVMGSIKPHFAKLGSDESPVHSLLHEKAMITIEANPAAFASDAFLTHLDCKEFREFMLSFVLKLYSVEVSTLRKRGEEVSQMLMKNNELLEISSDSEVKTQLETTVQQEVMTPLADEHEPALQECCEQDALEPEIVLTDDFSTISYSSLEYSAQYSGSLGESKERPTEKASPGKPQPQQIYPRKAQPEEAEPGKVYHEDPCPELEPWPEGPPVPEPYAEAPWLEAEAEAEVVAEAVAVPEADEPEEPPIPPPPPEEPLQDAPPAEPLTEPETDEEDFKKLKEQIRKMSNQRRLEGKWRNWHELQ